MDHKWPKHKKLIISAPERARTVLNAFLEFMHLPSSRTRRIWRTDSFLSTEIFKNSGIFLTYTVETSPVYLPWFWMSKMSKICRNFWHIFDYFGSFGFGFAKFSDIWNQGKYTGLVPTIKIPVRSKLGKVEKAKISAKCMVGSFNLGGFKLIKT